MIDFPANKAAIENPTFVIIFTNKNRYCLFSKRFVESNANEDIVVNEPQRPTAANNEYFPSKFHCWEITINNPRMNAPITFTIKTLSGKVLKIRGDSVILYLINAPITEPIPRNTNSRPFMNSNKIPSISL